MKQQILEDRQTKSTHRKPKRLMTDEQCMKAMEGECPYKVTLFKCIYFKGIKCKAYSRLKEILYSKGIKQRDVINLFLLETSVLEIICSYDAVSEIVKILTAFPDVVWLNHFTPIPLGVGVQIIDAAIKSLQGRVSYFISLPTSNAKHRFSKLISKMTNANYQQYQAKFTNTEPELIIDAELHAQQTL